MANLAATNNTDVVTEQLAQMRNDLQKLAQRYDSIALTAPIQEEPRPFSQPQTRRVVFEEPKQGGKPRNFRGGRSPSPRPSYGQNNRTHELPYNGGVGQNNGSSGRRDNYRLSFQNGPAPNGQPRCNKCGLAPHSNPLYCRAVNQQCNYCGKYGHYKRVCRLAKRI